MPRRHECVSLGLENNPLVTGEEINPSFKKESDGLPMERWHPIYTVDTILGVIISDPKAARGEEK
ncbi:hypothetical protein HQ586_06795 [Candidatus Bathyarchaeota archaeon]|nr:hypothetical protein [Candidatus Bathyarchaeota archaeon]